MAIPSGATSEAPSIAAMEDIGLLYVAAKGATNNNIYVRSMDADETWAPSWSIISGSTDKAPVLCWY